LRSLLPSISKPVGMLTLVLAASAGWAQEGSYECRQGELLRRVLIVYEVPGEAVPCQVIYSKPAEGVEDQALWSAANESGYCEFKAKEFRTQLQSWGWACSSAAAAPESELGPASAPEPASELEAEQLGDEPPAPEAALEHTS
jgi:hypothetical protein